MSPSVRLFRIAAETRSYPATDLSGRGAAIKPGRWNAIGEYVVYTSRSLSLAMVETVAHVDPVGLPLNRFVVAIDVPADMWDRRVELDPEAIDPAWCAIPAGMASAKLGSAWYQAGKSVFLVVPSVVVPEERNVLINAKHPDAQRFLKARVIRRFSYSEVLGRGRNR